MKSILKRALNALLIVTLVFSVTGCWDRVEINDRIFVLALGIDKFEPGQDGQDEEGDEGPEGVQQPGASPRNRIVVSIVFPNVGLLKGEGAIVPEEPKAAVSTVGPTIFEAMRHLIQVVGQHILRSHKGHTCREELVSDEKLFLEVLDELSRTMRLQGM